MKTRVITEDVSGSLNRRYFAEVESSDEVNVRREGVTTAEAARKVVASLHYTASDAERKFIECGVLPKSELVTTFKRQTIRDLLAQADAEMLTLARFEHLATTRIREALDMLERVADDQVRIE